MTTINSASSSFGSLLVFLDTFHPPVATRRQGELLPRQKELLEAFASGNLPDAQKEELIRLLSTSTLALEYLAALLLRRHSPPPREE